MFLNELIHFDHIEHIYTVERIGIDFEVIITTPVLQSLYNRTFWWCFCVVTLPFWHFCWHKEFCQRTKSELFLFLIIKLNLKNINIQTKIFLIQVCLGICDLKMFSIHTLHFQTHLFQLIRMLFHLTSRQLPVYVSILDFVLLHSLPLQDGIFGTISQHKRIGSCAKLQCWSQPYAKHL